MRVVVIILGTAVLAAAVAMVTGPIPGTSVMLAILELGMVYLIARSYKYYPTMGELASCVAAIIAIGFVLKSIVLELLTLVPLVGWLFKGIIAGIVAFTLGVVTAIYFRDHSKAQQ
jgi:uncharacterized protein (DUF697 family)